jgi:uncharacterized protein YkwD
MRLYVNQGKDMLNRTPPSGSNTTNVLNAYRKRRQQRGPFLIYGAAALLLIVGIFIVVRAASNGNNPISSLFATDTPTTTLTFTPTNTNTPTLTPTITLTPTETITPTPTGPVAYTIKEGDTLQGIADQFGLGSDGVLLILQENPKIMEANGVYYVGDVIQIPPAGTVLRTATPLSASLPRGTTIDYQVLPGDTLAGIAAKFNSIADNIVTLNKIDNANSLQAGQKLKIPVNLVTATPTLPATSTPVTPTIEGQPTFAPATATGETSSSSTTCAPTENAGYVTELQTLINNARTSNGLPALNFNQNLATAAKNHATDMVCNNYLSHFGLDGSTPETRVAAQGYTASLVVENLYALSPLYGGNPQAAFNWWMDDSTSRDNILNKDVTEFGIAYSVTDKSLLGGYFVIEFAKP